MLAKLVTIYFNFTTKSCILHLFVKNGKLSSLLYSTSALWNANAVESCLQKLSSWD